MKFILLVEGQSEKDSIPDLFKRWLDPLLSQPVGMQIVKFKGYSDFEKNVATKSRMHLNGPKQSEILAVIGLLDLYGPDYPANATTADERYAWGKAHFEREVDEERFRMHYAVHEFEAWLLSQPDLFPRAVKGAFPKKIAHPENVNFDEHPSKLLNKIYKEKTGRSYKKTTHGRKLFDDLDPNVAISKCPKLNLMLQDMLTLAKNAGL